MMTLLEDKDALKVFVNVAGLTPAVAGLVRLPTSIIHRIWELSMSGLNVRKDACELDFLSLGALVHRLDPGIIPFRKARTLEIHVSGGEYNVAANLVRLLRPEDRRRHRDGQLPDRRAGPGAASARWASRRSTSGSSTTASAGRTSPPSTATAATASARRSSSTTASNEAGALLKPGDFDWKAIFAGGVQLVPLRRHLRRAVGDDRRELIIEGMKAAKAAGRDHLVRPELPGQALGRRSAATSRRSETSCGGSSSTSTA